MESKHTDSYYCNCHRHILVCVLLVLLLHPQSSSKMYRARRSMWWRVFCSSSVLRACCGLLGGPNPLLGIAGFLIIMVTLPGSTSHSHASAGVATRSGGGGYPQGGHGAVGVNDGLLVAGSVCFGEDVPVPNLCVELRGYLAGEGPDQKCAFQDGGAAGCSSWWDPSEAPPKFQQLQRTDDPGGSFAFVTPASGMVLILAEYSHGGDYPTSVRFLQHQHPHTDDGPTSGGGAQDRWQHHRGDGSTLRGAQDRRHEMYGVDSGRMEVRINLSEGTDIKPEMLLWSVTARESDHSPCALESTADVDDRSTMWGGTSSALQDLPSWGNRHDLTDGNTPVEGIIGHRSSVIGHRSSARERDDDRETSLTSLQLTALLRSSCLDYGQQRAGLWEANTAVCGIFHSALETEQAHEDVLQNIIQNIVQNVFQNTIQSLVVVMRHVRSRRGVRGIVEAVVAFGGILFLLIKLLWCLFGASSWSSDDGYDHVSSACSVGGNSESLNDSMAGAFGRSTGGVSQPAREDYRRVDAMPESRRSDTWGMPTRVVANTTGDGGDDFDAFSSMFSTLDEEISSLGEASKEEVGRVVPRQSWARGSYVVFEQ